MLIFLSQKNNKMIYNNNQIVTLELVSTDGTPDVVKVVPSNIFFGSTDYSSFKQWIMSAWNVEKNKLVNYEMRNVKMI